MIIYLIRNKINNKSYIGLDRYNNNRRWKSHLRRAKLDKPIQLIDKKIKQYGKELEEKTTQSIQEIIILNIKIKL